MANVSVLNTTSQLSGKTVCVAENDQTVSGAWTFSGNQTFTGNVTLGNAVGDTVTVGGTIISTLIFTDNTYDIGASGATRPRDFFLARNATIGGTLNTAGVTTLATDSASRVVIGGGATASELRLLEPSGSGSNYTAFLAQAQAGNVTYTLPAADGTADYVLATNGSGTLSWAFPGKLQLLKANSGTTTSASAENVDTYAMASQLTALDTLYVSVRMSSLTQATAAHLLYNSTDSANIVHFQTDGVSGMAAGEFTASELWIRPDQSATTMFHAMGSTFTGSGTGTGAGAAIHGRVSQTTAWTGAWTLALRHGGVTAGGTCRWSWAVYRIIGQ